MTSTPRLRVGRSIVRRCQFAPRPRRPDAAGRRVQGDGSNAAVEVSA